MSINKAFSELWWGGGRRGVEVLGLPQENIHPWDAEEKVPACRTGPFSGRGLMSLQTKNNKVMTFAPHTSPPAIP